MRNLFIGVGVLVVLGVAAYLGKNLYVEHKMSGPGLKAAEVDAQARIASLVHGDVATIVDGLPPGPRGHQKAVLGEIHDALARLGPYGGATLAGYRATTTTETGVVDLGLAYDLEFPHPGSCVAHVSYEVKRGMPPLFEGIQVGGDCVHGLTQAEAHGLAP